MARILLVEDDVMLAKGLVSLLKGGGYAVDRVRTAEEAIELATVEPYNLLILDIGLPGMSGLTAIRHLRSRGFVAPILVLTARVERADRIQGLDFGADDYLGKPFDAQELLAHVRAQIRRSLGNPSPIVTVGTLVCDSSATSASVNGRALMLPRREWSVLWALVHRAGKVIPKERLLAEVFDYDEPVGPNAIEVYVARLRKKLAPDGPAIHSFRGLGYMMDAA